MAALGEDRAHVKEGRAANPTPQVTPVPLRDGSILEMHVLRCPLRPEHQHAVTDVLRTEWPQGDMRWEESLAGKYADSLRTIVCLGKRNDQWVGTASTAP